MQFFSRQVTVPLSRTCYDYDYDAWGNCTLNSGYNFILSNNPFRYRGYYYDTEIGLYYLQSRYYNPTWGRFINQDAYASTGIGILGHNMFAYCNNNPISYIDKNGNVLVATITGGIIGGLGGAFAAMMSGDSIEVGLITGCLTGGHRSYL